MRQNYELIIEPGRVEKNYWKDLFRFKELFLILAWKEFLIRYKQALLGVTWSVIRPVLSMIVFTVIFGKIAKLPSEGVPYPILVFSGMLPWQFFATSFQQSSNSLVANANLVSKIYFPRIIIPASSIIVGLIDFIISLGILIILMIWYKFTPSINILLIPVFLFLTIVTTYGAGILFAALNVKYRDFRYIIPFVLQFGMYISPVGFSSNVIPQKWELIYALNPMVGIINGFRWSIIGGDYQVNWNGLLISCIISLLILIFAVRYFRKTEKKFADVI